MSRPVAAQTKHWTGINQYGDVRATEGPKPAAKAAPKATPKAAPKAVPVDRFVTPLALPPQPKEPAADVKRGLPYIRGRWIWYARILTPFRAEVLADQHARLDYGHAVAKYKKDPRGDRTIESLDAFSNGVWQAWYDTLPYGVQHACHDPGDDTLEVSSLWSWVDMIIDGGIPIAFSYPPLLSGLSKTIAALHRLHKITLCLLNEVRLRHIGPPVSLLGPLPPGTSYSISFGYSQKKARRGCTLPSGCTGLPPGRSIGRIILEGPGDGWGIACRRPDPKTHKVTFVPSVATSQAGAIKGCALPSKATGLPPGVAVGRLVPVSMNGRGWAVSCVRPTK